MSAAEEIGEVKTTETRWRELTEQFGEEGFCMLCGRKIMSEESTREVYGIGARIKEDEDGVWIIPDMLRSQGSENRP